MIDFVSKAKAVYRREKQESSDRLAARLASLARVPVDLQTIHPLFKQEVGDTRYLLEFVRKRLNCEEGLLAEEGVLLREKTARQVVAAFEDPVILRLNALRDVMDQVGDGFSDEEHFHHKAYYQEQLLPLLLECPFTDRAYNKPNGFSGDYQTIKMVINEDPYQGRTLFGRVLQKWSYVAEPWGPSLRGRLKFLQQKLALQIGEVLKRKSSVTLLSLGAGGALEIQELIRSCPEIEKCRFHLVDFDPHAVRYCREAFAQIGNAGRSKVEIHFHLEDITSFLTRACTEGFLKPDIVYSSGIFDYLENDKATMMLGAMHQLAEPGGSALIGNFRPPSCGKVMLWYTYEWPLVMRTEDDLQSLNSFGSPSQVEAEETGVCLFLEIEKTAG